MAINDLLAALARDARIEARQLLRAGYAERKRELAECREQIEALRKERLDEKRESLQADMRGEVAAQRRRSRLAVASAQERLVTRVLERVRQSFEDESTVARLRAAVAERLFEVLRYAEDTAVEIVCGPSLVDAVQGAMSETSGVDVVAEASVGTGWIVRSSDASLRIDDTLQARMEWLMPQIRMAIVDAVGKEAEP